VKARAQYREASQGLDLERLKFVNESGVNLALTRLFGRAPKGERVVDSVPKNYGDNVTLLGALSLAGVEALMTVNGATDGEVFLTFVREMLAPTLEAGDVVIWDNLGAHRSVAVREAVEARGARLVFLPPYSPDMNPIERCWSKIKAFLRAAKARSREALEAAIKQALATVTESDARAWFAHCGYALN
jgi:transposase